MTDLHTIDLAHPALAGRTGTGVSVAVIDSGINPWHDHVKGVAGGVAIGSPDRDADFIDRLGHGTAVAAVIRERAPNADLFAVKVFDQQLATRADILAAAIDWATEHSIRLINLSLGTRNAAREPVISAAVNRARDAGAIVVSASEDEGEPWLPGSLPTVVGAMLDWECPRLELRVGKDSKSGPAFLASGFPRPLPGVPPERNLWGISFAVANVAAMLALALEGRPELRTPEQVFDLFGP